jgi:hypothetical protein
MRGFLDLRPRKLVRNMIENLVGNLDKPKDPAIRHVSGVNLSNMPDPWVF